MRAYILMGNAAAKENFVSEFIKKNNIASYNMYVFPESLKISEARVIKKNLATASDGKRLFVIKGSPKEEAQNALLKTLEELPDDTGFVFFDDRELLPTIVSRCNIVKLENETGGDTQEYEDIIYNFTEDGNLSAGSVILLVDRLCSEDQDMDLIEIALRNVMVRFIGEEKNEKASLVSGMLGNFLNKYSLITNNNLNKKLAIEKVILDSILQKQG